MKIAILGAGGCVGQSLISRLLSYTKNELVASYRQGKPHPLGVKKERLTFRPVDLADQKSTEIFLEGCEILIYLVHSLGSKSFKELDKKFASTTAGAAQKAGIKKIIYLGGIFPRNQKLSAHLESRKEVGSVLASSGVPTVELRASILLGACSISYRMVYFLTKRLPFVIGPKDLNSLCSPISLDDAVDAVVFLTEREMIESREVYEIGAETIRYAELLKKCAKSLGKKEFKVISLPLPTFLFSMWIGLLCGVDHKTAVALAESLKNNSNYMMNRFREITGREPKPIDEALAALTKEMEAFG
jgi:uncharacterized protein YbjT (DUF2867 family)